MKLAVPKELRPGEQRVALVPAELTRLTAIGVEVSVQAGAGALALYPDEDYEAAGAKVVEGPESCSTVPTSSPRCCHPLSRKSTSCPRARRC